MDSDSESSEIASVVEGEQFDSRTGTPRSERLSAGSNYSQREPHSPPAGEQHGRLIFFPVDYASDEVKAVPKLPGKLPMWIAPLLNLFLGDEEALALDRSIRTVFEAVASRQARERALKLPNQEARINRAFNEMVKSKADIQELERQLALAGGHDIATQTKVYQLRAKQGKLVMKYPEIASRLGRSQNSATSEQQPRPQDRSRPEIEDLEELSSQTSSGTRRSSRSTILPAAPLASSVTPSTFAVRVADTVQPDPGPFVFTVPAAVKRTAHTSPPSSTADKAQRRARMARVHQAILRNDTRALQDVSATAAIRSEDFFHVFQGYVHRLKNVVQVSTPEIPDSDSISSSCLSRSELGETNPNAPGTSNNVGHIINRLSSIARNLMERNQLLEAQQSSHATTAEQRRTPSFTGMSTRSMSGSIAPSSPPSSQGPIDTVAYSQSNFLDSSSATQLSPAPTLFGHTDDDDMPQKSYHTRSSPHEGDAEFEPPALKRPRLN